MTHRMIRMENIQTRQRNEGRYLEGHVAVFDREYEVFPGWVETIAPGAFAGTLARGGDVKALWNHNPDIVLGSTAAGTASAHEDAIGLMASILINENDTDAMNGLARVARGDVTGCSIGFDIIRLEEWWEGDVFHTKILAVELYEFSPCTFPAYKDTDINARSLGGDGSLKAQFEAAKQKRHDTWQATMLAKLKGVN